MARVLFEKMTADLPSHGTSKPTSDETPPGVKG